MAISWAGYFVILRGLDAVGLAGGTTLQRFAARCFQGDTHSAFHLGIAAAVPLLLGIYQLLPRLRSQEFEAVLLSALSRREIVRDVWIGYLLRSFGWVMLLQTAWFALWSPFLTPEAAWRAAADFVKIVPVQAVMMALMTSQLLGIVMRRRGNRDLLVAEALLGICIFYPILIGILSLVFLALFVMMVIPILMIGLFIVEVTSGEIALLRETIMLLSLSFVALYVWIWCRIIVQSNLATAEIACVPADWVVVR